MRKNEYRTIVRLEVPPLVASVLGPLAMRWTAGDREDMPSETRNWRSRGLDPKIPMWPIPATGWRVLPGGITFRLPGFSERCIATFADPAMAKKLWEYEQRGHRRSCYLMRNLEGHWWLSARYYLKEDYIAKRGNKRIQWVRQGRQRARWHHAPDGWPRSARGTPLTVREITRRVVRGELPDAALAFVSARTAADVRRRIRAGGATDGHGYTEHLGGTN